MTQALLKAEGWMIDYTPVGAVAAGQVVLQGELIGIAPEPIAASVKGALQVTGIATFVKDTGDGGLTVGALTYWDDSGKVATSTAASNKYLGKVVIGTTTEVLVDVLLAGTAQIAAATSWGVIPVATIGASGTGSGDSPIVPGLTTVSAANATKAITLPSAVPGATCIVKNLVAATLPVFPATGDTINGGTATTGALTMAASTSAIFVAYDDTAWFSLPLLPS